MFKINLLTIGSNCQTFNLEEYQKRLSAYCSCQILNFSLPKNKKGNFDSIKTMETAYLLDKALTFSFPIIVLDERGKNWSSLEFADYLVKIQQNSGGLTFLIGGADGFNLSLLENPKVISLFSLSRLTFPHKMVKLILLEQIYRAFTIINHHPYHRV